MRNRVRLFNAVNVGLRENPRLCILLSIYLSPLSDLSVKGKGGGREGGEAGDVAEGKPSAE